MPKMSKFLIKICNVCAAGCLMTIGILDLRNFVWPSSVLAIYAICYGLAAVYCELVAGSFIEKHALVMSKPLGKAFLFIFWGLITWQDGWEIALSIGLIAVAGLNMLAPFMAEAADA